MKLKITLLSLLVISIFTSCKKDDGSSYGSAKQFFKDTKVEAVELTTADGNGRVLLVPAWQGRVMTSTTGGENGRSYGWINFKAIASAELNPQFNSYGGEDRFWLGPEGGPFSWYFKPGTEQIYANWIVPKLFDIEAFDLVSSSKDCAVLEKHAELQNASGTNFSIEFKRTVRIEDPATILNMQLPAGIKALAYSTTNSIKNEGNFPWNKQVGMPSIWTLGCFSPTPTTIVFIPYNKECTGKIVKDDYFGEMPKDRLSLRDGFVFFKIDGKLRTKIGLPQESAMGLVGSYDSVAHTLSVTKYTTPTDSCDYVNSQWGEQENNYGGDVINSYNDGPTDTGVLMGPFYEIETSSPAAPLQPEQSISHVQYTIHMEGTEEELDVVARSVFGIGLKDIRL